MTSSAATRLAGHAVGLMLVYVYGFVLVLTLAPFSFELPDSVRFSAWESVHEAALNTLLFFPLGFLCALVPRRSRPIVLATCLGLLGSLAIELAQLALPPRLTSLTDLVANTLGATLGAWVAVLLRRWLLRRLLGVLVLELPSVNLIYLLVPMLWLIDLRPTMLHERILLSSVLGMTGALIIGGLWRYRLGPHAHLPLAAVGIVAAAWCVLGRAVELNTSPLAVALLALATGIVAIAVAGLPSQGLQRGKRFEGVLLWAALGGLLVYWVAQPLFPAHGWAPVWVSKGGWPSYAFSRERTYTFAETIAALSTTAYLLSAIGSRTGPGNVAAMWRALAGCAVIGGLNETVRGYQVGEAASGLRLVLGLGGAALGLALHQLQLRLAIHARQEADDSGTTLVY